MKAIADFLFEAGMLKKIPRSGYHFLGLGGESVAEHSFIITMIAFVMAKLVPEADSQKIVFMCLVHDLPEARIGDINYLQKKYVIPDEDKAVEHMCRNLPFGDSIKDLICEFNTAETLESMLARDADQIAFLLDLKSIRDVSGETPEKWIKIIMERLKTDTGRKIAEAVLSGSWDDWWLKNYSDPNSHS